MKQTIFALAGFLLLFPGNLVAEPTLKEAAQQQIGRLKEAKEKHALYSKLVEKYQQMFLQFPITFFSISGISKDAEPRTIQVFINGEEVFIAADHGWNLVANASGVYEWEAGKQTGIKIRRNNAELLSYLNYLTDPSGILSGLYGVYLETPGKYQVTENKEKGWTELRLKKPIYGFEAVFFTETPFWLHGMRTKSPAGKSAEMTISKPHEVAMVPEEIMRQSKAVKFEDSDLSLKRHLTFL
jgi:hypothetical protein